MKSALVLATVALSTSLVFTTAKADASAGLTFQCVEYARGLTRVAITGNASTWWDKAAPLYARGSQPREGAILVLPPHGAMQLGHVAVVASIVGPRRITLRHANWSPINGVRGQIEEDVPAIDVSPANDWSAVRIWYGPSQDLGLTQWPVTGFIYPDRRPPAQIQPAAFERKPLRTTPAPAAALVPTARRASPHPGRPYRDPIGEIIARKTLARAQMLASARK